jgi:hypothetical protein
MEFDHSTDTISPDDQPVLTIGGTGALVLPAGTTAQRPAATSGALRYNSDTQSLDFAINGAFQTLRGATNIAATNIIAAGTTQGTATAITAVTNNVTTVASGTGVILPIPYAGDEVVVVNNGANTLNVYPQSGSTISDLATNTPSVLAVGKVLTLHAVTTTLWEISSDTGTSGGAITLTGDVTGSGTTSITTTLATVNSSPQTDQFRKITVTGKGLVTATTAVSTTDIANVFGTLTNNLFYASPNGSAGTPSFRAIAVSDVPTLNQNTTGSAATWTTGRTVSLTGDVTGTSSAFNGSANLSFAATIGNGTVTLTKMGNLAANSIIGNNTGASAPPLALTGTEVTAMLNNFTSTLKGLVPASGGGPTNFLRADGTWATPAGGGGGGLSYANIWALRALGVI